MERYIARTNVDHYISLLNGADLTAESRSTITKMLIAEEDKLSHDLEQLEFAEIKASAGRKRVSQIRDLRDNLAFGTQKQQQADKLLVSAENLQTLLEDFCHRLRHKIKSGGL